MVLPIFGHVSQAAFHRLSRARDPQCFPFNLDRPLVRWYHAEDRLADFGPACPHQPGHS